MERLIKNEEEVIKLLNIAVKAGRILLESGSEVYRVEDTIERMCSSFTNLQGVEVLSITTSVIVTIFYNDKPYVSMVREKKPGFKLDKVHMVNDFSRRFVKESLSLDEALKELIKIDNLKPWPLWLKSLSAGTTSGFFSLMFGGSYLDFLAALIIGYLVFYINVKAPKYHVPVFINFLLAGFLSAGLAVLLLNLGLGNNLDMIIIGTLMPYVPGVVITNAIRDILAGDTISGVMTAAQAIFIAVAIAFGVGMILVLYL